MLSILQALAMGYAFVFSQPIGRGEQKPEVPQPI